MPRKLAIHRKTNETDIRLKLNLDGHGKARSQPESRFFDHMLELVARHGALICNSPRAATWKWISTTPLKTWASPSVKR